jgi:hypothetical protein
LTIQAVAVVRALGAAAGVAAGARATVGQARMPAMAGVEVGGERGDVEAKPQQAEQDGPDGSKRRDASSCAI